MFAIASACGIFFSFSSLATCWAGCGSAAGWWEGCGAAAGAAAGCGADCETAAGCGAALPAFLSGGKLTGKLGIGELGSFSKKSFQDSMSVTNKP